MQLLTYLLHALAHGEKRRQQTEYLKQKKISALEKKMEAARQTYDDVGEAQLLIQLGNLYSGAAEFELADRAYKQAIELAHYKKYQSIEMEALVNQGISYKERMEYTSAEICYQDALAIARKAQALEAEQQIKQLLIELENMLRIDELSKEQD